MMAGKFAVAVHECLRDCAGHNSIIGKATASGDELKVLAQMVVELKTGAGNITQNRSKHN